MKERQAEPAFRIFIQSHLPTGWLCLPDIGKLFIETIYDPYTSII
jgi:hypothetical protein